VFWLKSLLEKYLPYLSDLSNIDVDIKSQHLIKQETINLHSSNTRYSFSDNNLQPCYLQSLSIMTKDPNSPIEFAIRDINGDRVYIRAIEESGQGNVVTAQNLQDAGGQIGMLELKKYDDETDTYVIGLTNPQYCPNGYSLKLNEGDAPTTATLSLVYFNEVE